MRVIMMLSFFFRSKGKRKNKIRIRTKKHSLVSMSRSTQMGDGTACCEHAGVAADHPA